MHASVFLSRPTPYLKVQQKFLDRLEADLKARGLTPQTVGETDFSISAPLSTIRSLMLDCDGLIAIAFRRHYIEKGTEKPKSDIKKDGEIIKPINLSEQYFTSPWCQIEPAMAFQIGLPVLIFREKGVRAEGILEKGVFGTYMPEVVLPEIDWSKRHAKRECKKKLNHYFSSDEYTQVLKSWESKVWQVVTRKGKPRKLYDE